MLFATQPNTSEICPGYFMTNHAINPLTVTGALKSPEVVACFKIS